MSSDLFSNTNNETTNVEFNPQEDYTAVLVGEGKKYKDQNALAFSRLKADEHIARLEREQNELRQELDKRLALEQLIEKIESKANQTPPKQVDEQGMAPQTVSHNQNDSNNKGENAMSKQDIATMVQEMLSQETSKITQEQNVSKVQEELKKVWGNSYSSTLTKKQEELGLSKEFLSSVAAKSPEAFLKLVGARDKPSNSIDVAPPRSSVGSSNHQNVGNEKNYAYYRKMQKENPRLYYSPKVQLEMHNDALRLGENFNS